MAQKNLYIIAGCNGAGKTTASFNILPEILSCNEFINADEIARGISPFNPDSVAFEAGRLMLSRISELMNVGVDFAFETTLATRSYVGRVKEAQKLGYRVTLLFYWLESLILLKNVLKSVYLKEAIIFLNMLLKGDILKEFKTYFTCIFQFVIIQWYLIIQFQSQYL